MKEPIKVELGEKELRELLNGRTITVRDRHREIEITATAAGFLAERAVMDENPVLKV